LADQQWTYTYLSARFPPNVENTAVAWAVQRQALGAYFRSRNLSFKGCDGKLLCHLINRGLSNVDLHRSVRLLALGLRFELRQMLACRLNILLVRFLRVQAG